MTEVSEEPHARGLQPSLFDSIVPAVALTPAHKMDLTAAVEVLLREIAAALVDPTAREGGHD